MKVKSKLKHLKELDAHMAIVEMDKQVAINSVLTSEIKAKLADIDIEFDEISKAIRTTAAALEAEIKAEVLVAGVSTKNGNDHYGASFVNGRVSWDTGALDGYAVAHPGIEKFRKIGAPSVRINKRAGG